MCLYKMQNHVLNRDLLLIVKSTCMKLTHFFVFQVFWLPHGTSFKESTFGIYPGYVKQVGFLFLMIYFMWLFLCCVDIYFVCVIVRSTGI